MLNPKCFTLIKMYLASKLENVKQEQIGNPTDYYNRWINLLTRDVSISYFSHIYLIAIKKTLITDKEIIAINNSYY